MARTEETGYDDSNRAFLQAFLARGSMTFDEARPILAAIFSAHENQPVEPQGITEEDFSSYVAAANTAISPFDFEIRSAVRQGGSGRERVYALVNTTSDALTQLATTYTVDEIAFIKRVLDAMFTTYNTRRSEVMAITSMQAMQLAKVDGASRQQQGSTGAETATARGSAQSLGLTQAETVIKRLVEEGWLERSRSAFYSLSPRALMELREWLVATYNDDDDDDAAAAAAADSDDIRRARHRKIKFCAACLDIITAGQRCGNRDCAGRLHEHCMRNYFRVQRSEKCPVCKADWPGNAFVGEKALTATEHSQPGTRRTANNRPRASGAPRSREDVEDDGAAG